MDNNLYTVYCHTHIESGKKYFGITSRDPEKRFGPNGCRYLKKSKGHYNHPAFANAILKYGWDAFSHEILFTGLTLEEANAKEMELIAKYKTNVVRYGNEYGYNCTDGGDGATGGVHYSGEQHPMYGKHHTEEARRKMSEFQKERYSDPSNHWRGEDSPWWGKKHTEEYKRMMSERIKGEKHPLARKVMCVETGEIFSTAKEAADKYGAFPQNIIKVCRGKIHTSAGFHWQYADLAAC